MGVPVRPLAMAMGATVWWASPPAARCSADGGFFASKTRNTELLLREASTREEETVAADALFVLIGAHPHTDWLPADIVRDSHGFLCTGEDLPDDLPWPLGRPPLALETSMPGVLAAGDVRHGSVKRVASAVGEGSVAVQLVHNLFDAEPTRSRVP